MINFYRGLKHLYDPNIHGAGIYFTTDTLEIIHGDKSYSGLIEVEKHVADITFNGEVIIVTYSDGTTVNLEIPFQSIEIIDNLTSDAIDKALSAKQGKFLLDKINGVTSKLVGVYTYKGSKNTYNDLPTNASVGDVWNVIESYNGNPSGTNYAWAEDMVGGYWDALGGSIDLSNYCTNQDVKDFLTPITDQVDSIALTLNKEEGGIIKRLELTETILGDPSDSDKTKTILSRISDLERLVSVNYPDETLLQKVNDNTLSIINITNTLYGTEDKLGLVKEVEILNGNDSIEGSVDNKINQALAWVEL